MGRDRKEENKMTRHEIIDFILVYFQSRNNFRYDFNIFNYVEVIL